MGKMKKMKNKIILLVLIVLIILVPVVLGAEYKVNDTKVLNSSNLPYNQIFNLNVSLLENETIWIDRLDNLSEIDVVYGNEFNLSSNDLSIDFNATINDFDFTENTTISAVFNITNSYNNNSIIYYIIYDVEYISLLVKEEIYELSSLDGDKSFEITSNLLPKVGLYSYNFKGVAGETLFIDCPEDSFLTCPSFKIFDNNNETTFDIEYFLSSELEIDTYNYGINFRMGNKSIDRRIVVVVKEPSLEFKEYIFDESCFKKVEGELNLSVSLDCISDQQNFLRKQQLEFFEALRLGLNKSEYCDDYIVYEDNFVIVGNVSEDIYNELRSVRTEKGLINSELNRCTDNLEQCTKDLKNNNTRISLNAFDLINDNNDLIDKEKENLSSEKSEFESYKTKYNKSVRNFYILMFFVILILIYLFLMNKQKSKFGRIIKTK